MWPNTRQSDQQQTTTLHKTPQTSAIRAVYLLSSHREDHLTIIEWAARDIPDDANSTVTLWKKNF